MKLFVYVVCVDSGVSRKSNCWVSKAVRKNITLLSVPNIELSATGGEKRPRYYLGATLTNGRGDRPQRDARLSPFLSGTLITIGFAVIVVWSARSYGRTVGFAFGVNWILIAWAIWMGRVLETRSGTWDGLSSRLPASYYITRPFEKGGRIYDYFGVRWYQRLLRRVLWFVNPALLRSQPGARQTMIRATHDPEAGHLLIFAVILVITLWAFASGWWDTVAWLLLFNLLHNGYPVLSVRQIRARLSRRQKNVLTMR